MKKRFIFFVVFQFMFMVFAQTFEYTQTVDLSRYPEAIEIIEYETGDRMIIFEPGVHNLYINGKHIEINESGYKLIKCCNQKYIIDYSYRTINPKYLNSKIAYVIPPAGYFILKFRSNLIIDLTKSNVCIVKEENKKKGFFSQIPIPDLFQKSRNK